MLEKSELLINNEKSSLGSELYSEVLCASVKKRNLFSAVVVLATFHLKNRSCWRTVGAAVTCNHDDLCVIYNNTFYSHFKKLCFVRPNNITSLKENVNKAKSSNFPITGHKPPVCLVNYPHLQDVGGSVSWSHSSHCCSVSIHRCTEDSLTHSHACYVTAAVLRWRRIEKKLKNSLIPLFRYWFFLSVPFFIDSIIDPWAWAAGVLGTEGAERSYL